MREEDEDADLVDDPVPARNNSPPAESRDRQREDMIRDIVIDALRMAWFKRHPGNSRSILSAARPLLRDRLFTLGW
jgi:hypothetical protein